MNMGDPTTVTTGVGSVYGGSKAAATASGFVSQINITNANYLFGNFNQNGIRDFDSSVVEAQKAQAALDASSAGDEQAPREYSDQQHQNHHGHPGS